MPRWLGLTARDAFHGEWKTTPSYRDRQIKLLFPDRPLVNLGGQWKRQALKPASTVLPERGGRKLWLRKGFGFAGAWTVCEQNRLLALCLGLPEVNKV